ncbi:MAG: quinol dehydrogenase ferredoxin subunit NapH [Epsilonproteobacteria bacterium]|nr:MAG: quinol dehydrogenase ferredoxin subunit NapH [Campylobacterota bacterium]
MNNFIKQTKYLILRRITQFAVIFLYFAGNIWGWQILTGNLSSSQLLTIVPLSDPFAVMQMFFAGAAISIDVIIGALIVTSVYAIIGGRVFCSWVCPINPITDLANYLRRKFEFNKITKRQPSTRNIRFWVLGLSFVLSFFLLVPAFEFISPISMVHRGIIFGLGFTWAVVLVIFFFDMFVLKNGWCGHICPLGAFYGIVGKFSLIRVFHDVEKCTECMKCKEVCPEVQVLPMIAKNTGQVSDSACTNCGRCLDVCEEEGALSFSILGKNS